jgi:hypothetical protein
MFRFHRPLFVFAAIALTGLPATILAHHSISGYFFIDQRQKLEGTVVEFEYKSPHAFIHMDARDPGTNELVRWSIEWGPVRHLESQGVHADSIKPGDQLVILGNPPRRAGEHSLHLVGVLRPSDGWKSGREVDLNAPLANATSR